jgi:hypothetical protein
VTKCDSDKSREGCKCADTASGPGSQRPSFLFSPPSPPRLPPFPLRVAHLPPGAPGAQRSHLACPALGACCLAHLAGTCCSTPSALGSPVLHVGGPQVHFGTPSLCVPMSARSHNPTPAPMPVRSRHRRCIALAHFLTTDSRTHPQSTAPAPAPACACAPAPAPAPNHVRLRLPLPTCACPRLPARLQRRARRPHTVTVWPVHACAAHACRFARPSPCTPTCISAGPLPLHACTHNISLACPPSGPFARSHPPSGPFARSHLPSGPFTRSHPPSGPFACSHLPSGPFTRARPMRARTRPPSSLPMHVRARAHSWCRTLAALRAPAQHDAEIDATL